MVKGAGTRILAVLLLCLQGSRISSALRLGVYHSIKGGYRPRLARSESRSRSLEPHWPPSRHNLPNPVHRPASCAPKFSEPQQHSRQRCLTASDCGQNGDYLASWFGSCIAKQGPESLMLGLSQAELLNAGGSSPVDTQDWEALQDYDGLLAQGSIAAQGRALAAALTCMMSRILS